MRSTTKEMTGGARRSPRGPKLIRLSAPAKMARLGRRVRPLHVHSDSDPRRGRRIPTLAARADERDACLALTDHGSLADASDLPHAGTGEATDRARSKSAHASPGEGLAPTLWPSPTRAKGNLIRSRRRLLEGTTTSPVDWISRGAPRACRPSDASRGGVSLGGKSSTDAASDLDRLGRFRPRQVYVEIRRGVDEEARSTPRAARRRTGLPWSRRRRPTPASRDARAHERSSAAYATPPRTEPMGLTRPALLKDRPRWPRLRGLPHALEQPGAREDLKVELQLAPIRLPSFTTPDTRRSRQPRRLARKGPKRYEIARPS